MCTNHVKYIKTNLFTMNIIIHSFIKTDELMSFIYDVYQEERSRKKYEQFSR